MNTIHVLAPAKLNLTLDVLGLRPDGYHELDMLMQAVSLCDEVDLTLGTGKAWSLVCVGLNWLVYYLVRRKRPSLLVFAFGLFCLLAVAVVEYDALPASAPLASTLAVIGGCLALAGLFLLSYWFAARRSRPAHVIAVGLWIIIGIVLIPAVFIHRILSARRGTAFRRRATGLAEGRILQIVGETRLDRDEDLVTDYHARVEYTVNGVSYETRADIAKITMRRFGKKAFVGQKIPVHYDPDSPASAYTDRIDRHFFDQ